MEHNRQLLLTVPLEKCCGEPYVPEMPKIDPPKVAKLKVKHAGARAEMEERHSQERRALYVSQHEEISGAGEG